MTICRLMVLDFMENTGRIDADGQLRYDDMNLEEGQKYARWLIDSGYETEPFFGFDLIEFEQWCKNVRAWLAGLLH